MTVGKHLLHFTLISESNKTNVPSLGPQSQKQTNNMVGKKKKEENQGRVRKTFAPVVAGLQVSGVRTRHSYC